MEKIFKDKHGREFIVKTAEMENPNTGEIKSIDIGQEPRLNPNGQQVRDPLVMHYDYLGDVDVLGIFESDYPFLYFGSEFGKQTVRNLPTEYTYAIDSTIDMGLSTASLLENHGMPSDEQIKTMYEANKENIINIYVDQFISSIITNIYAIYNNNLRFILEGFLKDNTPENKAKLTLFPVLFSHELDANFHKIINKNESEMTNSMAIINNINGALIYNQIANAYSRMIENIMRDDLVDFYELARNYAERNNIKGIAPEFLYSYGVDLVREIANQEVGRLCDMVEINLNQTIILIYQALAE